jgi:addiction module RelB/DinJ family antitoxin
MRRLTIMEKISLTVEVDKEALEQATQILDLLELPLNVAVNVFLHAVVGYRGIPFMIRSYR